MCKLLSWMIQLMDTLIYQRPIKMKPIDVKASTYLVFRVEINYKDSKFEIGDHVKTFLQKVTLQIGQKMLP